MPVDGGRLDGVDVEATIAFPVDRNRPDLHARHLGTEVTGAGDLGRDRLVEGPLPGGVAVPDRGKAFSYGRCRPAAQTEHMTRAEGQAHDAVAGDTLAVCRRKLRVRLDLPGELGRLFHTE